MFSDLSYQAAQRVMLAEEEDELATLKEISQNFPVQTRLVSFKAKILEGSKNDVL